MKLTHNRDCNVVATRTVPESRTARLVVSQAGDRSVEMATLQWVGAPELRALSRFFAAAADQLDPDAPGRRGDREKVYDAIDTERDYQDNVVGKGPDGRTDGRQKAVGDYLTLIRAYSARADAAYADTAGDGAALHVIRKIAGICVQAMEVHGAPPRETV